MITRACKLLGIAHPVVLGGMGTGTSPELVVAVSNAGGLGVQGCAGRTPAQIADLANTIRAGTGKPFGLNLLLFLADDAQIDAVLAAQPAVFSSAWPWPEQDLGPVFERAHQAGAKVMHMVSTVHEARRAADAGADIIVAQGTEGGGHVGLMGSIVLVPQVARTVAPLPVVAAGGFADGAGLAAALMLGAEGVLLGTRFLATPEAPLPASYKQAICSSDGHDTLVTELLRRVQRARAEGDLDNGSLLIGQDAGLIDTLEPAGQVVERIVREAEEILGRRTAEVVAQPAGV